MKINKQIEIVFVLQVILIQNRFFHCKYFFNVRYIITNGGKYVNHCCKAANCSCSVHYLFNSCLHIIHYSTLSAITLYCRYFEKVLKQSITSVGPFVFSVLCFSFSKNVNSYSITIYNRSFPRDFISYLFVSL